MCLLLREALTVGRIAIGDEFFSNELKHTEAKLRIKDELSSYCVVTEPPKTTFGKIRKTYTGKLYGKQDDLCIAIQLSLIGCQRFFQEPKTATSARPTTSRRRVLTARSRRRRVRALTCSCEPRRLLGWDSRRLTAPLYLPLSVAMSATQNSGEWYVYSVGVSLPWRKAWSRIRRRHCSGDHAQLDVSRM